MALDFGIVSHKLPAILYLQEILVKLNNVEKLLKGLKSTRVFSGARLKVT